MPKMAPWSSARQLESRQSESPRLTRSGRARSRSVEIGRDKLSQTITPKRRTRQGSAESVNSSASGASNAKDLRRRARSTVRNLSTVAENGDEEENEADYEIDNLPKHSPSNLSQVSGTTAFSNTTSYSVKALADIDHLAAERLPELCNFAQDILELLAPPNATKDQVESIFRDLKISGSERAESLREAEDKFKDVRELYGNRETFIQARFISKKLSGKQSITEVSTRPDAIIHVANLATMVKEFLVYEQHSVAIHSALGDLENFPTPFLTSFDNVVQYGSSRLMEETFEMFLDIITQSTIAALRDAKEQDNFSPDELLAIHFFNEPAELTEGIAYFDDVIKNGNAKGLSGAKTTQEELVLINRRVEMILFAFRDVEDAQDKVDLVDFEKLEEMFPWLDFLTKLVNWTRKRLVEALQAIEQQGGLEYMGTELLQISHGSVVIDLMPGKPAAEISQINLNTAGSVKYLQRLKRAISSSGQPAAASKPPAKKARLAKGPILSHSPAPESDNLRLPELDDANEEILPRHHSRPTEEYVARAIAHREDGNKENRPNVRKIGANQTYEHQQSTAAPSKRENPSQDVEEESSEDEGFMIDKRVPNPFPKRSLPPGATAASEKRPSNRARVADKDERDDTPPPTFEQVSRLADAEVELVRFTQTYRTQVRTPWSAVDEEYLKEGIRDYGCKWAALAKRGGFEVERDQGALKDKARNMVVKYYRGNTPLPYNFENVALGKKEIKSIQLVKGDHWQPPSMNNG